MKTTQLTVLALFCIWVSNLNAQIVYDIDGNVYRTRPIGNQIWLVENLKTTRYNDGSYIPEVPGGIWSSFTLPGHCWYNNDSTSFKDPFGALYNWYAVKTGKLCPLGWHVPTDSEWTILINLLGGESIAGSKLKEAGNGLLWLSLSPETSNNSGFTARPGGARDPDGSFHSIGIYTGYWSSTEANMTEAIARDMQNDINEVGSGNADKKTGFSVRCIQDN